MTQRISILGCGWLGLPLAFELTQKGYITKGSTTSDSKVEILKSKGIISFIIDIGKREYNFPDFLDTEVLIISIPSKKIEDFKYLINQIEASDIKKVIFISSTSVYPFTNQMVTEDTPIKQTSLSEIELLFKSNLIFNSTIIRFGGLFGYDRKPGKFIQIDKKIKNPEGYVNLIHRDDCIQIIESIIQNDIWNETFNACADTHPKRKDFYKNEIIKIGRTEPLIDKKSENKFKIVSSEKMKTMLNYSFKYSDLLNYDK